MKSMSLWSTTLTLGQLHIRQGLGLLLGRLVVTADDVFALEESTV
jgi:hypothetical protein